MLYFNGVYPQHYIAATTGGAINFAVSGTCNTMAAGTIGLFLTDQNGFIQGPVTSGTTQNVTLGMGSWHTVDYIGSMPSNYAGLQCPQFSKTIAWQNVTRFEKRIGQALQNQVVSIGWDQTTTGPTSTVGPVFYCATSYELKVEVLGDAALAAVNKQIYNNIQAWGGCCSTGCSSGCTSTAVDAAYIMLQWKDRINQNPVLNQFISPAVFISSDGTAVQVYDAYDNSLNSALPIYVPNTANPTSVIASLQISVAYVATVYGTCTFTPRDRFEYSPLWIHASLVSQSPDPCAWNTTINTSVPNMFTELQAPKPGIGLGDFIMREWITSNRYRQQPYDDSMNSVDVIRMREIENDQTNVVNRSTIYDQIILVFNAVGQSNSNPTSVKGRLQYMLCVDIPTGTNDFSLMNVITNSLTLVGSNVVLQTI